MSSAGAVTLPKARQALWLQDLVLALLATLLVLAVAAATGFRSLDTVGDNDSLLRLVEVRDLIAGQGWFDLHQYRMGPEGGFIMHWSRLVDAPVAAIILVSTALGASMAVAETAARVLWPAAMFLLTVFFTLRAARRFGGDAAVLPALVTSAAALHFLGIYGPGALDHHNVQLMLTMASVAFLLAAPARKAAAALAGVSAALMLAVGMETAPYVAVIGAGVAILFVLGASGERIVARDYGLGFAAASAAVFLGTVSPAEWGMARCDAFSAAQFVLAALAGTGLAAVAATDFTSRGRARRLAALAVLGAVLAAVLLTGFPECLAAPYAALDPRLRTFWLDHVSEAQSVVELIRDRDTSVAARYATPVIALVLMVRGLARGEWRRQDVLVGMVLAAAFVVSIWQYAAHLLRRSCRHTAFAVDRGVAATRRNHADAGRFPEDDRGVAGVAECRLGGSGGRRFAGDERGGKDSRQRRSRRGKLRQRYGFHRASKRARYHGACPVQSRRADPRP